jgi:tetratricopeptide (TPR) repeat protein
MKNKFLGRDREINHLFEAFNYVAQKNNEGLYSGPRIVSIISESGLGKSRLVQELYCRIANTELYNPSAFGYWPKEFNDNDVNLQVTPKMDLQVPKGPPKFLWVGSRWPPVNERNQASRDSVFPEIKQDLSIHESIIRKMSPAWLEFWNRTTSSIKADFSGEVKGQVTGEIIKFALDMSVPFSGLISGVIKNTLEMAIDRSQTKDDYTAFKESKSKDEVEEMLGIFTKLLSDKHAIPIVLWLDDAHWADDLMQSFIHTLVYKAKEKKWPLLVIITHWQREYHEQLISLNPTALSKIIKHSDISDVIELTKIDYSCLVTYVNECLPGVTKNQVDLLCEKCDGNFLSMVENVGLLLSQPRYFNNRDITSYLSDIGTEKVTHWESNRQRRVKQRFDSLEPMALQDALALGADQGVRFLPELIIKHLEKEGIKLSDGINDFDKCIVPFSIITKHDGSPDVREFRDKLYLKVSLDHFSEFHKNDIDANSSISKWDVMVQQWLTQQINDCFDSAGNIIDAGEKKLYLINGTQQELHAILALGLNKLDLSCPSDISIRFTCLLVHARSKENAWSAIARDTGYIKAWNDNLADFNNVVSESVISDTLESLMTAGSDYAALYFSSYQYAIHKINNDNLETNKSLIELSQSTRRIAAIYKNLNNNEKAEIYYFQSLDLSRKLVDLYNTPENNLNLGKAFFYLSEFYFLNNNVETEQSIMLFDEAYKIARNIVIDMNTPEAYDFLSTCIHNNAMLKLFEGNYSEALVFALESHSITMKLYKDLGTNDFLKHVQVSLGSISMIYRELGNLSEALTIGLEGLAVAKILVEKLETPASYKEMSVCLSVLALIQGSLENHSEEYRLKMECLEIEKMLADQLDTPASHRDVARSLIYLSHIHVNLENLTEALNYGLESLAIAKKLSYQLDTPESHQDIAGSLKHLSCIQANLENLPEALKLRMECLTIQNNLAEQLGTPESYRDVSASLHTISYINRDLGNLSEALTFGHECLAVERKIAEQLDDPKCQQDISLSLCHISEIQFDLDNLPEALALRMESLEIQKKLAEQLGTPESNRKVSASLYAISCINRDLGNLSEALTFGHECLAIERKVAEQLDAPESYRDIATSLFCLSGIQMKLGNSGEARALGMESLAIARKVAEQSDTVENHELVDEIETFINNL